MNRHQKRAALAIVRATRGDWTPFEVVTLDPVKVAAYMRRMGIATPPRCFRNNQYAVQLFERSSDKGPITHAAISRHDKGPIRGWDDIQRIKNEVCGAELVGFEVYPASTDKIDQANMRHLFVMPPGVTSPFTIEGPWT